jgi:NitT/TauT family transport system substrate-binding protein
MGDRLSMRTFTGVMQNHCRWRFGFRVPLLLCLYLLTGCSPAPPEPLRIGTNIWPGYEPLYLARELGYYDDQPIRLVEHAAATEVLRAFRNGTIEAAALTLDEVLLLAQHGQNPRIVLVMDFSQGGDALIAQTHLSKLDDLRGRRIGVESTALGAYMLKRTLDHAGLEHTDVEVVSLPVDKHERAFLSGQIDAVVTFEPVRSKLLKQGANELFDSSRIPGEIVDVLVVRQAYLERQPEVVEAMLDGWFKALAYHDSEAKRSAAIMARRHDLSVEEFLDSLARVHIPSLQENIQQLSGPAPALNKTASRLQSVMLGHSLQDNAVELDTLYYPRSLKTLME